MQQVCQRPSYCHQWLAVLLTDGDFPRTRLARVWRKFTQIAVAQRDRSRRA
jgi:hypothetical protein